MVYVKPCVKVTIQTIVNNIHTLYCVPSFYLLQYGHGNNKQGQK